jgi:hypothetical protein
MEHNINSFDDTCTGGCACTQYAVCAGVNNSGHAGAGGKCCSDQTGVKACRKQPECLCWHEQVKECKGHDKAPGACTWICRSAI